jgi:hypothetical protein
MRYFLSGLLAAAWGLWFGGLVFLFLSINRLFETMQLKYRDVFDVVAPYQFMMAERFGLVVGVVALLSAFGLRLLTPGKGTTWTFIVLAAAAATEIARPLLISGRMLPMIQPGQPPSPQFLKLHGIYMGLGSIEAVILLIAAFALPAVMKACAKGDPSSG